MPYHLYCGRSQIPIIFETEEEAIIEADKWVDHIIKDNSFKGASYKIINTTLKNTIASELDDEPPSSPPSSPSSSDPVLPKLTFDDVNLVLRALNNHRMYADSVQEAERILELIEEFSRIFDSDLSI